MDLDRAHHRLVLARRGAVRGRAGFTLAEMLAVLLIVSILTMLAVPKLDIAGVKTTGAMHTVGTTLLAAQRAAVTRQHDVAVAFDEGGRRLRLHYDRDNDAVVDAGEGVRWEPLEGSVVFGRGGAPRDTRVGNGPVSFAARRDGMPAVVFRRNGSASEEGGFYLTSGRAAREGDRPGDARLVVIDRPTGRASWFEYRGGRWTREF